MRDDPQVFRFEDDEGREWLFSIPKLRASVVAEPERWVLTNMEISRTDATYLMKHRGVDEARVRAFPLARLNEPGIMLIWFDGSQLTVDGNHRLVKRVRRGLTKMDFWTAEAPVWRQAVLERGASSSSPVTTRGV